MTKPNKAKAGVNLKKDSVPKKGVRAKPIKAWAVYNNGKIGQACDGYNHWERANELSIYETKQEAEETYCRGIEVIIPVLIIPQTKVYQPKRVKRN